MPKGFSGSPDHIIFTDHARDSMAERGFTENDVRNIIYFGHRMAMRNGRWLFSVLPSPFAELDSSGDRSRLTDCSVIFSADCGVITVYRNDGRCPLYRTFVLSE